MFSLYNTSYMYLTKCIHAYHACNQSKETNSNDTKLPNLLHYFCESSKLRRFLLQHQMK